MLGRYVEWLLNIQQPGPPLSLSPNEKDLQKWQKVSYFLKFAYTWSIFLKNLLNFTICFQNPE